MAFDPCPHQITQIVLKAGAIIRQLRGLSEEKNITTLYNETAPLLGIQVEQMKTGTHGDHFPSIAESMKALGLDMPKKPCPKCGAESFLYPICQSCADAEGGKYKTGYRCVACNSVFDKSEKVLSQLVPNLPSGIKKDLGILTITDKGLE